MIALEYFLSRIIGLCLTFFCFTISSIQISLLLRRKSNIEIKYYIHYCCLSCTFFTLIIFIDPDGVYQLIPFLALSIVEDLAAQSLATGLCFVVYSHFHAHYLSLREKIPPSLGWVLSISVLMGTFLSLLGTILTYALNRKIYYSIVNLQSMIWIIVVVGSDLVSYFLVRYLVLNALECEKQLSSSSIPPTPMSKNTHTKVSTSSHQINYHEFLKRMRNFHVLCLVLGLLFFSLSCAELLKTLQEGANPPKYPTPETFTFNLTAYGFLFLIVWTAFTWWSWVPIRYESEVEDHQSSKETHLTNSERPSSRNLSQTTEHDVCPPTPVRKALFDTQRGRGEEEVMEEIQIFQIQPNGDETSDRSVRTLDSDLSERSS